MLTGKINLFCFAYAGGSAAIYAKWGQFLHGSINLIPIELAGRGKRINEPFYNNIEEAIEDIYSKIETTIKNNEKYAFFGHSMGSLIAYRLVCKIIELGINNPIHVFFSGSNHPHMRNNSEILHLSDEEFINRIIMLGGTPREVFEDKELRKIFLPILRADYKVIDTCESNTKAVKLSCNITVLTGTKDDLVTQEDLLNWKEYTYSMCNICQFEGDHFFINNYVEEIVRLINSNLLNNI